MTIKEQVPLRDYTTFKLGGPADFFVSVGSVPELTEALAWANAHALPFFILAGGSNVVFPDEGFRGVVIHVALKGVTFKECGNTSFAITAAGEEWDAFVAQVVEKELWGIENLSAIPGSVGATPVQNVGAYGVEVSNVIEWVDVLNVRTHKVERFNNDACRFAYRDSVFKRAEGKKYIVLHVCFKLSRRPAPQLAYRDVAEYFSGHTHAPALAQIREAIIAIRARKFPDLTHVGTAGSFFLNPIVPAEKAAELRAQFPELPVYPVDDAHAKVSIAWILDRVLGFKGKRSGAVGAYERHVLALVNHGGATADELCAFARDIQQNVFEKTGIKITPEVTIVANEKLKTKK